MLSTPVRAEEAALKEKADKEAAADAEKRAGAASKEDRLKQSIEQLKKESVGGEFTSSSIGVPSGEGSGGAKKKKKKREAVKEEKEEKKKEAPKAEGAGFSLPSLPSF